MSTAPTRSLALAGAAALAPLVGWLLWLTWGVTAPPVPSDAAAGGLAEASSLHALADADAARRRRAAEALLTPLLGGDGAFGVTAHVQLDATSVDTREQRPDPTGQVVQREVLGAGDPTARSVEVTYTHPTTDTHRARAAGSVQRVSGAAWIDPQALDRLAAARGDERATTTQAVHDLLATALGLDPARGDVLVVHEAVPTPPPAAAGWIALAPWAVAVAALLLALSIARGRSKDGPAQPADGAAVYPPDGVAPVAHPSQPPPVPAGPAAGPAPEDVGARLANAAAGADGATLAALLAGEHPQAQAVALASLHPDDAARALHAMPPAQCEAIVRRMATTQHAGGPMVRAVQRQLADALEDRAAARIVLPALAVAAKAIGHLDDVTRRGLLDRLDADDAPLADALRDNMLVLDDLVQLDDRALQAVLRRVDRQALVLALRGAGPVVTERLLRNLSRRARIDVLEDVAALGPVPSARVTEAHRTLLHATLQLVEAGDIPYPGSDRARPY